MFIDFLDMHSRYWWALFNSVDSLPFLVKVPKKVQRLINQPIIFDVIAGPTHLLIVPTAWILCLTLWIGNDPAELEIAQCEELRKLLFWNLHLKATFLKWFLRFFYSASSFFWFVFWRKSSQYEAKSFQLSSNNLEGITLSVWNWSSFSSFFFFLSYKYLRVREK